MKFSDLNLNKKILDNLSRNGYETPTLIQERVIPLALEKKDILGCAQTGTGKTASFALPIIHTLAEGEKGHKRIPQYLVLTPTRELAKQIFDNFKKYSVGLNQRFVCIYGGESRRRQVESIKNGIDVAICTPGRLLDILDSRQMNVSAVNTIVLDEADIMLDMGFIDDVKTIISKLPKEHQTLFFSATMPKGIKILVDKIMKPDYESVMASPSATTLDAIEQYSYCVDRRDKKNLLLHLISEYKVKLSIVFVRTKMEADSLQRFLKSHDIQAKALHGDKEQRQRERIIREFKANEFKVLVATDVASRGLHVDNITHIFNYDLPDSAETYVHRIGRTGRANTKGIAISLFSQNEKAKIADIQFTIKKDINNQMVDFSNMTFSPLLIEKNEDKSPNKRRRSNSNRRNSSYSNNKSYSKNNFYNKDNGDFKKRDGNFRRDNNDFKKRDGNYRKDNSDFKKRDGNFRRDNNNFKKRDGNYRKDNSDFKKRDGNYRKDNKDFKKNWDNAKKDKEN